MSIRIEDLDRLDFSDLADTQQGKLPPIHPGEILREEFLIPMGITQYRLSKEIGVSQRRIGEIVTGKRAITPDTGLRLARFFGTSDGFWVGLQLDFDTAKAKESLSEVLARIHRFDSAPAPRVG
jgi:addiction module HigA family antidote